MKIGFIGQGYIGKNYADDFERRGFSVVRYSLEPEFVNNKEKIKDCDFVFIAVPTPTTEKGFDGSIVKEALRLIGKGKTSVIKSTVIPGTTESFQKEFKDIFILHSPEFLSKATAAFDSANPKRNIVGLPFKDIEESSEHVTRAEELLGVLPKAPYQSIVSSRESELIKYASNCFYYSKVVFMNLLYNMSEKLGTDWQHIRDAMAADPMIGASHIDPVHKSGRGAGGICLIKDFAAFTKEYEKLVTDELGQKVLQSLTEKNLELLIGSGKDLAALKEVYGDETITHYTKGK